MAAIRERTDENGQKSYQAQVRIQGYPPRSKTFLRKTAAKKWAVQTETEIRTGMHIRQSQAGKHTPRVRIDVASNFPADDPQRSDENKCKK